MKVCKLCGKEITDTDRRSYCSKECAVEANRIRSREKYHTDVDKLSTPVKCANCGKEFIRKQEKQKYCCYSCDRIFHNQLRCRVIYVFYYSHRIVPMIEYQFTFRRWCRSINTCWYGHCKDAR